MCERYPIWQCSSWMEGGPLDHVALWTDERDALADFLCERDPAHAVEEFLQLGFERGDGPESVVAGDKTVYFVEGPDGAVEKPLLNHLALLVDSHREHVENAKERGLEYEEVDAANTWAVFVTGPYGIRIEYVEH